MEGEAREECRVAPGFLCWPAGLEEVVFCHAGPRGVWEAPVSSRIWEHETQDGDAPGEHRFGSHQQLKPWR